MGRASGTTPWGSPATKAIRRMIGFAHVTDIETLDEPDRSVAAAAVLRIGRRLVLERAAIDGPTALWTIVQDELREPAAASR